MSDDQTTVVTPTFAESVAEPHREFVKNKGWDSPDKAVQSYVDLEKFVGAEKAGRGLILPNDKSTPEEVAAFHGKLGVPAAPAEYEIKLPEGFPDPEFAGTAANLLHKHHVPKSVAQGLMTDFMAQVSMGEKARVDAEQAEFVKQEGALKTEWGDQFDKNAEIAKRGMKRLGLTDEVIDQMEAKAGFAGVIKAMYTAGMALGEGKFVDGDSAASGAESHDDLMARRLALSKDAAWSARFNANDPVARDEWRQLEEKIAAARKRMAA